VGTQFIVTFRRHEPEENKKATDDNLQDKVGDRVGENLNQNQQKILDLIQTDPHISARMLSEAIGISQRKVEANISILKKKGLLRRVGPAKGGHWETLSGK